MDRRAFLAGVSALGAGCVGGGGQATDASTGTRSPTRTETGTETETRTPTPAQRAREAYPEYDWRLVDDADPVATTTVRLRGFEFSPTVAAFEPGAEVVIVNEAAGDHSLTAPALDVDVELGSEERTTLMIPEAGTYEYVCRFHPPEMVGAFVVTDDPEGVASATATPTDGGEATTTEDDGYY